MTETPSLPPGTPSWVDLASPDVGASVAFYGGLFGWNAIDLGPEAGNYHLCNLDGLNVAGIGPIMMAGQPPAWTTYVNVEDADATAASVAEAGGIVFAGPMDVMDKGRMAIFGDPGGALLGLWQPDGHPGAALVNEPGSLVWNELTTRDVEGAKVFYGSVFGWGTDTHPMGDVASYTEWKLGERTVGGMLEMQDDFPEEMPPFWLVYFAVADCDASLARATGLGGTVMAPPMDLPVGRMAVLMDPAGAAFAVMALAGE